MAYEYFAGHQVGVPARRATKDACAPHSRKMKLIVVRLEAGFL